MFVRPYRALLILLLLCSSGAAALLAQERAVPQAAEAQAPLGTAFTYQGQLADSGRPASGAYDFTFKLFDAATGGAQAGPTLTKQDVAVSNGLFTVQLDFGAVFEGTALFLEVTVQPGDGSGSPSTLTPRQPLTGVPGALYASSAGALRGQPLSGAAPASGEVLTWDGAAWEPQPVQGLPGPQGPQGPSGASGSYGDGSAGALTVGVASTLDLRTAAGVNSLAAKANLQFTTITINGTLIVPSGTVLRATGAVVIGGTITVDATAQDNGTFSPHPGIALSPAASLQGGTGLALLQASSILHPELYGGGGGARSATTSGGGGGIIHLVGPTFSVTGTTQANSGAFGATGGAAPTINIGGGGGAAGGNGGNGGSTVTGSAVSGSVGYVITTTAATPENLIR